jgi:hypothetical protein
MVHAISSDIPGKHRYDFLYTERQLSYEDIFVFHREQSHSGKYRGALLVAVGHIENAEITSVNGRNFDPVNCVKNEQFQSRQLSS